MKLLIALTFLLAFSASSALLAAQCRFEILVKTSDRRDAGTDAVISLQVSASSGPTLVIPNLESWGEMPAGHDYFEGGDLDRFGGTAPCMPTEPCKMVIKSDGSGNKPGWYLDYVMVTQLGLGSVSSMTGKFPVYQWLAIDEEPHMLSVFQDHCGFFKPAEP
jgi:hypothetical protein